MTPMTAEECLHALRVDIDSLIQKSAALKKNLQKGNREIALVHTKLQEAKMWTGKTLEEHGSELPVEFQDKAPSTPEYPTN